MEYGSLTEDKISKELFKGFVRHQKVTKCWRKVEGEWVIKDIEFIDDWTEKEYSLQTGYLKNTSQTEAL
jgi:hypothetical protein